MITIDLFKGQVQFDNAEEAAAFWVRYLKYMVPGIEEKMAKATGADFAKQFGPSGKA